MRPTSARTFRFDSLLGSQHTCQRLCRGKTKPGLVHDVPVQKSLIYRLTFIHLSKGVRFVEDGLPVRCCDLLELALVFEARDLTQ